MISFGGFFHSRFHFIPIRISSFLQQNLINTCKTYAKYTFFTRNTVNFTEYLAQTTELNANNLTDTSFDVTTTCFKFIYFHKIGLFKKYPDLGCVV